jgi:hypothetical protein
MYFIASTAASSGHFMEQIPSMYKTSVLDIQNEKYSIIKQINGLSTRKRSWLRHYARRRKVAGSIPDDVIGFFN